MIGALTEEPPNVFPAVQVNDIESVTITGEINNEPFRNADILQVMIRVNALCRYCTAHSSDHSGVCRV